MTTHNIITGLQVTSDGEQLTEGDLNIAEIVVEQHTHVPNMFSIRLYDNGLEWLHNKKFDLTKKIEVKVQGESGYVSLVKGEVTSLEPIFDEGKQAELIIHGFDLSHRLYREVRSEAYLNVKDSDLASQIAGKAGLSAQVEATSTVYEHLYQHNQSDLNYLRQRAWRIGYECYVSGDALVFQKPKLNGGGVTLTWGDDLISFRPRLTLAEQVDEVSVRGWDPETMKPIVGQAKKGMLYPKVSEKTGDKWASTFGAGKRVVVEDPVVSQAEADILAAAHLDELSGAFIQAEGVSHRRPDICAGQMITLEKLGDRLSGDYLVTSATHVYKPSGFKTYFKVTGSRSGSLLGALSAEQVPQKKWGGVVVGVVTNTDDPNVWGRVKVQFPWMSEDFESSWARVIGGGAGPTAGFFIIPQVGDEVLVAFELGDFDRPIVIGGVWNGVNTIPKDADAVGTDEKPLIRTLQSIEGHIITVDDIQHQIRIVGKDEKVSVILDEQNGTITIAGQDLIKLESKSVEIDGTSSIKLSSQDITLESTTISLNATDVSVTGNASIKLNG